MIRRVVIIPTGDEVRDGIIVDTDSPMIRDTLLRLDPDCEVQITEAVADDPVIIRETVLSAVNQEVNLIVLIGGSGGGHRHSASLGMDYTHSALDELLPDAPSGSLYGMNGHLWCRLICGQIGQTLILNVPGPYAEAQAAIEAFTDSCRISPEDLQAHNRRMLQAVRRQYGSHVQP